MADAKYTPGPWRWELNASGKNVSLVGGVPAYDLTIIEPIRWGMGGASFAIRDTAHDGMNIMHKLHERADWVEAFPQRNHHFSWCANVIHPDMRLIAAAPEMAECLTQLIACHDEQTCPAVAWGKEILAKALGDAA